jgi:hypothetical protein
MGRRKASRAASQLRAVSKALARELEVRASAKEIATKLATLQKQREGVDKELAALQEILNADPELTAIAREMMTKAAAARGGGVAIPNPKYVSSDQKKQLLLRILRDYGRENPGAEGMSYAAIKSVLRSRYGIETASAGLFFRNELREWESRGGNKNKSVVLKIGQIRDQES